LPCLRQFFSANPGKPLMKTASYTALPADFSRFFKKNPEIPW